MAAIPAIAHRVDEEAVRWAVRSAHGEMTSESRAELEAWLEADRRHRGAYLRAQAGLHAMEHAVVHGPPVSLAENDVADQRVKMKRPAARWVRVASACAAMAACVVAVIALDLNVGSTHRATPNHVMNLRDGSIVTLGSDAKIEVALSDRERQITLVSGEASFKVAKDSGRPFVVRSGEVFAQATGTEYSVRRLGVVGAAVHVAEGSVLVWARHDREQAVLLHAGGELTLDPGPEAGKEAQPLPSPVVAQISLDDVSIAVAVARFNNLNDTKIVIDDPVIGEIRIIGLFSAHDPERFANAAATLAGAQVVRRQGDLVLTRR